MARKYETIADDLRHLIQTGELGAGDWLPAEERLAEQYGVNRRTVRRALNDLVEEGRVDRQPG